MMSVQEQIQAEEERRRRAAAQQAPPAPVTATGLGKAAATGLRSGTEAIPATGGDVPSLAGRGAGWAAGKVGLDPEAAKESVETTVKGLISPGTLITKALQMAGAISPETAARITSVQAPTSADVANVTDPAVSAISPTAQEVTRHVPQNPAEEYTSTVTSLAPAALAPGSIWSRLARVLGGGTAIEGAGQATRALAPEYEDAARIVAGLLAGGTQALAEGRSAAATRGALERVGTTPEAVARVKELLAAQGMTSEDIASKMRDLGGEAMPIDIEGGTNFRQEAQKIQAAGGEGRGIIDPLLRAREAGKNRRLMENVTSAVGPEVQRQDVLAALKDRAQALSPKYDEAHAQQVKPVETQGIIDAIDSEMASTKAKGKLGVLQDIRDSLNLKDSGELDPSSEGLHSARKAIDEQLYDRDGNVRKDLAPEVAGTLKHYRKQIDAALGEANPALKEVDVQRAQIGDEERAFKQGGKLYRTDDKALSPVEFERTYNKMSPGEQARLLDGVNRETWKQLGISSNNLVQLKSVLKGDGKWNHQKLATVVGEEKASALMQALERETAFNESYNKIVQGSKTAETLPEGQQRPSFGKAVVNAGPDVIASSVVGGPYAGGAVAGSHLKRYLTELMSSRGSKPNDAALARMLSTTRPDEIANMMKVANDTRGPVVPQALLTALMARRQDLEERKDQ
jgi:hypothetical protein